MKAHQFSSAKKTLDALKSKPTFKITIQRLTPEEMKESEEIAMMYLHAFCTVLKTPIVACAIKEDEKFIAFLIKVPSIDHAFIFDRNDLPYFQENFNRQWQKANKTKLRS